MGVGIEVECGGDCEMRCRMIQNFSVVFLYFIISFFFLLVALSRSFFNASFTIPIYLLLLLLLFWIIHQEGGQQALDIPTNDIDVEQKKKEYRKSKAWNEEAIPSRYFFCWSMEFIIPLPCIFLKYPCKIMIHIQTQSIFVS